MYTVLIFHDGRDEYLIKTLDSFKRMVKFNGKVNTILVADCPDQSESDFDKIKKKYKIDTVYVSSERMGIFGAVQKGWQLVPKETEYIFHLENDFVFNEEIDVETMRVALQNKHIYQVALLRQPWYSHEIKRGGLYKALGNFWHVNSCGVNLVAHRHYFTHNPCLYRSDVVANFDGYDEYSFMQHIIKKDNRGICTYLGKINDKPKVTHIGDIKQNGKKSAE